MAKDILEEVLIVAQFRPLGPAGAMGPGGAWSWTLAGDCSAWLMDRKSWMETSERFAKTVTYAHGVAVEEALSGMMERMCDVARTHGVHPVLAKIEASGSLGHRRLLASVGCRHDDGVPSAAIKAARAMFGSSVKGVGVWTTMDMAPPNDERLKEGLSAIKEALAIKACMSEQELASSVKSI